MLIIFVVFVVGYAQPSCEVSPLPPTLPLTQLQSLHINLNDYFTGPNLTRSLNSSISGVKLQPEFMLQSHTQRLGQIISIKEANNTITMLGVSLLGQYIIYYDNTSLHDIQKIQLPASLIGCSDHGIAPDGRQVLITCMSSDHEQADMYVLVRVDLASQEVRSEVSYQFEFSESRKVEFVTNDIAVVLVMDHENSYLELWNVKYLTFVYLFDRVSLGLDALTIMDMKVTNSYVYILDYGTGIYQLIASNLALKLFIKVQVQFYTKFAVYGETNQLAIGRKGTLAEMSLNGIIKYEVTNFQQVRYVLMNQQYIIVYKDSEVVIYIRSRTEPYLILPLSPAALGTFTSSSSLVQFSNLPGSEVHIDQLLLFDSILSISYDLALENNPIEISAISIINSEHESCNMTLRMDLCFMDNQKIYRNLRDESGIELISMNRPGTLSQQLAQYGIGANISYSAIIFNNILNISLETRKMNEVSSKIQRDISDITSVRWVSASNEAVVIMNSEQLKKSSYLRCTFDILSQLQTCSRWYQEAFLLDYRMYRLFTLNNRMYEAYTTQISPNLLTIRQLDRQMPYIVTNIELIQKYSLISSVTVTSSRIYILIRERKQIHVYSYSQQKAQQMLVITKESLGDIFFAPTGMEVDDDGRLWVKQFNELLVLMMKGGTVQMLFSFVISDDLVYTFDYRWEKVGSYLMLIDSGETLFRCEVGRYLAELKGAIGLNFTNCQHLPRYGMRVQSPITVDAWQHHMGVVLYDDISSRSVYAIYHISALSVTLSYFAEIGFVNQTLYSILTIDHTLFAFTQYAPSYNLASTMLVNLIPTLEISIPEGDQDEAVTKEALLIKLTNRMESLSHSGSINIANYQQNLTRGYNYPAKGLVEDATSEYICIDSMGWLVGNILKYQFICSQCSESHKLIYPRQKLWMKDSIDLPGGDDVIRLSAEQIGITFINAFYVVNIPTENITAVYQISSNPQHRIQEIEMVGEIGVVLMHTEESLMLLSYSFVSEKGFPMFEYVVGGEQAFNMEACDNVVTVSMNDGIYMLILRNDGSFFLADYISKGEVGGMICWFEILGNNNGTYVGVITVCDVGITVIKFTIQEQLSTIYIENRQQINLLTSLQKNKIHLPNGAFFQRTLITQKQNNMFSMLMLVYSFNSIQWLLSIEDGVVKSMGLTTMLHRYYDHLSEGGLERWDRYTIISYSGMYEGRLSHVYAVYDHRDEVKESESTFTRLYIMEALVGDDVFIPKFMQNNIIVALNGRELGIYDVDNAFRAQIRKADEVMTDTVLMVPYPKSNEQIQVRIEGIQNHEINVLDIIYILLYVGIGVLIGFFLVRVGKKAHERSKMVKLTLDEELVSTPSHSDEEEQPQPSLNINRVSLGSDQFDWSWRYTK